MGTSHVSQRTRRAVCLSAQPSAVTRRETIIKRAFSPRSETRLSAAVCRTVTRPSLASDMCVQTSFCAFNATDNRNCGVCIGRRLRERERERGVCSPSEVFCILAWENGDRIRAGTAPRLSVCVCALVQPPRECCHRPLGPHCERAAQT